MVDATGTAGDTPATTGAPGLTLRDYFAAKALQGFCANPESERTMLDTLAEIAYAAADEMLKRREEK